ncbi:MAG: tRNA (adenosine(37)-N6)-threonylcarbamoyltransferase complex transferase subunit TsaD [Candidatus Kapaibacteriales bacterium]
MKVLGIETSCDETSAAVATEKEILSNVISSQVLHQIYGGVVPEIASRLHIQIISQVVNQALSEAKTTIEDIDGIAVTFQPGLIGSLVVGTNFAKGLALRYKLPLIPIDHIEGHIFSGFLEGLDLPFPFVVLVVSGGHTTLYYVRSFVDYEVIGATRDDAAGEAFDKIAKLLGLGYPGGPLIDKLSKNGDKSRYFFPRGLIDSNDFHFSFSGLKTSVKNFILKNFPKGFPDEQILKDISASVQEAIVDVLVTKSFKAVEKFGTNTLVIAGGVSANTRLCELSRDMADKKGINLVIPKIDYCMDNAAMIGYLGVKKLSTETKDHFMNIKFRANPNPVRSKVK